MAETKPTVTDEAAQRLEARKQQLQVFNTRKQRVSDLLESYRGQIAQALPSILTPDRMIRVALSAMIKNPKLMECTGHSLISCVLTCAQLGLMPDDILGEAYLIPFNNTKKNCVECTVIPGYRGLCTLAMRSGQVKSITALAVYAANEEGGDIFDYDQGLNERLEHKPSGMTDQNRITHFYAIVRLNNGHIFRVMTRAQVEAIRNESKNYKFSDKKETTIWGKYFDEMGCKTVLRRTLKYVPLSPEIAKAIAIDEAAERGKQNTQYEFLDEMPGMAEDIGHEVLEEQEGNAEEKSAETKDAVTKQSEGAIKETLDAIGKNQKVDPK